MCNTISGCFDFNSRLAERCWEQQTSASMMGLKYCNGLTADLASKNSISFATHQTVGKQITLAKVQSAPEERGCILRQFRTIQFLG